MGFNWKAFGAAFLDKQTEGIKKRRTDAEEFEDKGNMGAYKRMGQVISGISTSKTR